MHTYTDMVKTLSICFHTHTILKFHYLSERMNLPLTQMRILDYKCQCLL